MLCSLWKKTGQLFGITAATTAAMACVATAPKGEGSTAEDGSERDPSVMLSVGTKAPDFAVPDHAGNMVRLADFAGASNIVLIFYPGNDTPGCTRQLCAARDDFAEYQARDTLVFGVNPASRESHSKFAEKHEFPFPLLVDSDGALIRAYGCRGLAGVTTRTVYVIDKSGTIVFAQRGMPATDEILAAIPG